MSPQAKSSDQLKERTLKSAIRLLKAKMRQHVYQAMSEADSEAWAPILLVESGFLSGALREWAPVIAKWDLKGSENVETLHEVLEEAKGSALADTIDLLTPRVPNVAAILQTFLRSPEVSYETMAGGGECKLET